MNTNETPNQSANPENQASDPFLAMASAARDVEPKFSAELHARVLRGIEASATEQQVSPAANKSTSRNLQAASLQFLALATSFALLLAAGWLWNREVESPGRVPVAILVNSDQPTEAAAPHSDAPQTESLPIEPTVRHDHEDLTTAINYMLTLGGSKESRAVATPPSNSTAQQTPWLHPVASQETLAFELDQQRLRTLAKALFAMQ